MCWQFLGLFFFLLTYTHEFDSSAIFNLLKEVCPFEANIVVKFYI